MASKYFNLIKSSYNSLIDNNKNLNSEDLYTEIINLASYIYLRKSEQIDFNLDFIDKEVLESFVPFDFTEVNSIAEKAAEILPKHIRKIDIINIPSAVEMNIQLAENYGEFLKKYYVKMHNLKF